MQIITKWSLAFIALNLMILSGIYAGHPVFRQLSTADKSTVQNGTIPQSVSEFNNHSRSGPAIYDQMFPLSQGYMVSHQFMDQASLTMTCNAADDFVVPEGDTWTIHHISAVGAYWEWNGTAINALNIVIYENDNGVPGDVLHSFADLTSYTASLIQEQGHFDLYEINLPQPVILSSGTYWLSIQAVSDFGVTGQWGWATSDGATIGQEFYWINPLDGFGYGATEWTPGSYFTFGSLNMSFAFYGPGLANDLALKTILSPNNGPNLTATELVNVRIKNEGPVAVSNFDVNYSINGGQTVTENAGTFTISPNQYAEYSFTQTANLSEAGIYNITSWLSNGSDPLNMNDTASKTVYNYGTVYVMPSTGIQEITTCGGTWTDSGGLEGDIGMEDDAITTIYPSVPGDRIQLIFLEFNASWGGFEIYNGTSVDAPLIGNYMGTDSPGVVDALNSDGALTIHFMGPGWETTPGWVAYINCTTPLQNELALTSFSGDLTTVFEGNTMTLYTTVRNMGSLEQSSQVTFNVNGNTIGSLPTGTLAIFDTVTLSMEYTFPSAGPYVFTANLPDDDNNSNNILSISREAYAFNAFFEDFESNSFPPDNWRHGGYWSLDTYNFYSGSHSANGSFPIGLSDTLITCRLDLDENALLSFYATTSLWWPGNLDIYFFSEQDDQWHFVQNTPPQMMTYSMFTVDLSAFAGQTGRIGFYGRVTDPFVFLGSITLDLISGTGITVHYDDYDLNAVTLDGPFFNYPDTPATYTVTVRNDGMNTIGNGAYNVKLINETTGLEIATVAGQVIERDQTISYNLQSSFNNVGNLNIYGLVEYTDDYMFNNTTGIMPATVLADSSYTTEAGTPEIPGPLPASFTVSNSLTETIFTPLEVGSTGTIFGLSYSYLFNQEMLQTPVRIWVDTTSRIDFGNFIPSTQLTLVYEGNIDFIEGDHQVYIPFNTPFNYSDTTKNLVVMFERTGVSATSVNFKTYISQGITSIIFESDDPIDPATQSGGGTWNSNPYTVFVFNNHTGSASGLVHNSIGSPLPGATISIGSLNINTETDTQGTYSLPWIPVGNWSAKAELYGYMPNVQILEVLADDNTVLDFELTELPMVAVSGNVEGNDQPGTGISGALVHLTGYGNYSTITDNAGNFSFPEVYISDNYELTITAEGYDNYVQPVTVSQAIQLGTITLTEAMAIAAIVTATDSGSDKVVTWNVPTTSASDTLIWDDGRHSDGYAGEPTEQVWLGNKAILNEPVTVVSFDVKFVRYGISEAHDTRFAIFSENGRMVYKSPEFMNPVNDFINVDVPDLMLHGTFYFMLWFDYATMQSDYLAFDTVSQVTPNLATYHYEGGSFSKLSELTGVSGSFLIHANVITDNGVTDKLTLANRTVLSYEIKFGHLINIEQAQSWPVLGSTTETSWMDELWPPASTGEYLYAVKTTYTTGESDFSFSNVVPFGPVGTNDVDQMKFSIYPNPASSYIFIEAESGSIVHLFDMQGRLLDVFNVDSNQISIETNEYGKGTILIAITKDGKLETGKVVLY